MANQIVFALCAIDIHNTDDKLYMTLSLCTSVSLSA